MTKKKAIMSWSGGKDSAYCLYKILQEEEYELKYLLTSLNENFRRISMHGVRETLLDLQAESIGIPLLKVWVSEGTNEEYERQMQAILLKGKEEGIEHVIFGDIFLEDLRIYRENYLAKVGMKAIFPLWQMDTQNLVECFIAEGFKTVICCTNDGYLGEGWTGAEITEHFVAHLPSNVDPCGENGEYHSFCFDGPIFKKRIDFKTGDKVYRPLEIKLSDTTCTSNIVTKGFWFIDLIPTEIKITHR